MFPGKIQNKTNGVTPRRWLHRGTLELSALINDTIGEGDEQMDWLSNMTSLRELKAYSTADDFVQNFIDVKLNANASYKPG